MFSSRMYTRASFASVSAGRPFLSSFAVSPLASRGGFVVVGGARPPPFRFDPFGSHPVRGELFGDGGHELLALGVVEMPHAGRLLGLLPVHAAVRVLLELLQVRAADGEMTLPSMSSFTLESRAPADSIRYLLRHV